MRYSSKGFYAFGCLILGACSSSKEMTYTASYDYHAEFNRCSPKNLETMNAVEKEHTCASSAFEARKQEMDRLYKEVVALYKKQEKLNENSDKLEEFKTSQARFNKFIKKDAKLTNTAFRTSYPYNYFGSMTDYVNTRIRHLQRLKNELAKE